MSHCRFWRGNNTGLHAVVIKTIRVGYLLSMYLFYLILVPILFLWSWILHFLAQSNGNIRENRTSKRILLDEEYSRMPHNDIPRTSVSHSSHPCAMVIYFAWSIVLKCKQDNALGCMMCTRLSRYCKLIVLLGLFYEPKQSAQSTRSVDSTR